MCSHKNSFICRRDCGISLKDFTIPVPTSCTSMAPLIWSLLNWSCELLISILKSFTARLQFIIIPHAILTLTFLQENQNTAEFKGTVHPKMEVVIIYSLSCHGTWETTENLWSMCGFKSFQAIKMMLHKSVSWSMCYIPCLLKSCIYI